MKEMISIEIILIIGFIHWIGDFVLQTDRMAKNKSKSIKWLSLHVIVYTSVISILGVKWGIINGLSHLLIDFVTSKVTSFYYKRSDHRKFFIVVGFDQYLHLACLLSSYALMK